MMLLVDLVDAKEQLKESNLTSSDANLVEYACMPGSGSSHDPARMMICSLTWRHLILGRCIGFKSINLLLSHTT